MKNQLGSAPKKTKTSRARLESTSSINSDLSVVRVENDNIVVQATEGKKSAANPSRTIYRKAHFCPFCEKEETHDNKAQE